MTWYTAVWLFLGAVGGITELIALVDKDRGDTLSEHVWQWFRVRDARPTPVAVGLRVVLLSVMVWLTGHFGFGWWTL